MQSRSYSKGIYVLIAGCTGTGKSTLATRLAGLDSVFIDDPYSKNPFIEKAYSPDGSYYFQSEMFFFKEFLKIHNYINLSPQTIFQERSVYETVDVFCHQLYEEGKIDKNELDVFREMLREIAGYLRKPDCIIYLKSDIAVLQDRIKLRGRKFEASISKDFLIRQSGLYGKWVVEFSQLNNIPVITLDNSDMDIDRSVKVLTDSLKTGFLTIKANKINY